MKPRESVRFLAFCQLIRTAVFLNCTVYRQSNGSALCKLSEPTQPNCDADWAVNGNVVAHADAVNKSVVLLQTADSLLLKDYHVNITYMVDCPKGLQEIHCNDPVSSELTEAPREDDQQTRTAFFALSAVVFLLVVVLTLSVVICWWKKKGCFQRDQTEGEELRNREPLQGDQLNDGRGDERNV